MLAPELWPVASRHFAAPLQNCRRVEAHVVFELFAHDFLFLRRRDFKQAQVGEWRVGSFKPAINDSGQVDSAIAASMMDSLHAAAQPSVSDAGVAGR